MKFCPGMNRRDFLKLLATAATIAVVAKPLNAVQTVTPPELLLRPSYLAWLNEAECNTFVWIVCRRYVEDASDAMPTISMCLEKIDLPRDRSERLGVLLGLQDQHPWARQDWSAACEEARNKRDDAVLSELMDVYNKNPDMARVFTPDEIRGSILR